MFQKGQFHAGFFYFLKKYQIFFVQGLVFFKKLVIYTL